MDKMSKNSKRSKKPLKRRSSTVADHNPPQDERMVATVRAARDKWRSDEQALRAIEAAASVDPVGVAERLVEFADWERRRHARYARLRFGAEVRATGDDQAFATSISGGRILSIRWTGYKAIAALSVARPKCWPRNLHEEAYLDELLAAYEIADLAHHAMIDVGWDVKEAGYTVEDMAWTMCQIFVRIYRHRFVFSGVGMEEESGLPPRLRELHTALTAGWVASRISLKKAKQLSAALAKERGGAYQTLLRELPTATFIGWADARHKKDLVSSVTRSLKKLGREAVIRPGKVRDAPLEEASVTPVSLGASGEDEDLVEFELRETLRQQHNQLHQWIEKAGFSQREQRVYELDMQTDFNTKTIARELGINAGTVRQYRKRYHDKLREVHEASGF